MKAKLLLSMLIPFILAGCSTIGKPTNVNNLQIKVAHLERRLNQKEYEIEQLKSEVEALSQVSASASSLDYESVRNETFEMEIDQYSLTSVKEDDERIIRVPISVETLQKALKNSGHYEGSIDGKIGLKTIRGISNFQKEHDLVADGIVGRKTWAELKSYIE